MTFNKVLPIDILRRWRILDRPLLSLKRFRDAGAWSRAVGKIDGCANAVRCKYSKARKFYASFARLVRHKLPKELK